MPVGAVGEANAEVSTVAVVGTEIVVDGVVAGEVEVVTELD